MGIYRQSRTISFQSCLKIRPVGLVHPHHQSTQFILRHTEHGSLLAILRLLLRRRDDRQQVDILVVRVCLDGDRPNELRRVSISDDLGGYLRFDASQNVSTYYAIPSGTSRIFL